jgi:hypothetical protein
MQTAFISVTSVTLDYSQKGDEEHEGGLGLKNADHG